MQPGGMIFAPKRPMLINGGGGELVLTERRQPLQKCAGMRVFYLLNSRFPSRLVYYNTISPPLHSLRLPRALQTLCCDKATVLPVVDAGALGK